MTKRMTIAVLGPKGTFSHEIAEKIRKSDEDILFFPTIHEVFNAVSDRSSGYSDLRGIVPVENSGAGGVFETLGGLIKEDCVVCAEYYLPIRYVFACSKKISAENNLQDGSKSVSLPALSKVLSKVYAHPQAHAQCSVFLSELDSKAPVVHTASNAKSAEETLHSDVSEVAAAVTTRSAAGIYGLKIICENIQNFDTNTTRFLEIRKISPEKISGSGNSLNCGDNNGCVPEKCSIVVMPGGNYPGLLYRILSVFAKENINLTRIESRPSGEIMGKYMFFIDYDITPELSLDGNKKLLDELRSITDLKELGCYPKANIGEEL